MCLITIIIYVSFDENFLTMKTQEVVLKDVSSSSITGTSGVPLSTVLCPMLFIFTQTTLQKENPHKFVYWLTIAYHTGKRKNKRKRKEQIINNFQKSCFSAVTWTICRITSIVEIVRVEAGRNLV